MRSLQMEEHRKSLLPSPLRKMSRFLMISGVLSFVALVLYLYVVATLGGQPAHLEVSTLGLSVSACLGLASYGLLRGKSWGLHLGMICGILVITTPVLPRGGILQFASLTLFRIPYVFLLLSTRRRWKSAPPFPLSKTWWVKRRKDKRETIRKHGEAASLKRLADFYRAQGKYVDAEALHKRTREIERAATVSGERESP